MVRRHRNPISRDEADVRLQLMLNNLNSLERTRSDFESIAAAAGFKVEKVIITRGAAGST